MNLSQLIDPSYILDSVPPYQEKTGMILLIFFLLLFLVGILVNVIIKFRLIKVNKIQKKYLKIIPKKMYLFGFLGLIYLFFRYEGAVYLSSRVLLYALFMWMLVWGVFFAKKMLVNYPHEIKRFKNSKKKNRYKPGS